MLEIRDVAWPAESQTYRLMALVIIAATLAARAQGLLVTDVDWDEGVYFVMAQQWLLGGLPYVTVWDQHPPGLPALLAMVQTVVPDPVLGARLAATLAVMVTALLIQRFCVRYVHQPITGLTAGLLYIFCMSRWLGIAANTEVFNNACTTFAAYTLYGEAIEPSAGRTKSVLAAAVMGVGLQIKYVVFPEAVLLSLGFLAITRHRHRDVRATVITAAMMIAAGCLPTVLAMLYFWAHGTLGLFLDVNIGANIAYLEILPSRGAIIRCGASGLMPILGSILLIGYAVTVRLRRRRLGLTLSSPHAWILLWTVAAVANVCLPLKFFTHYYFALYPPVCLGGALALSAVTAARGRAFGAGLVVLFAAALTLWLVGDARAARGVGNDMPREAAAFLRSAGARDGSVFVYNYQPIIYALARVRPPTRYVLGAELSTFSHSAHVDGAGELRRVMAAMPEFVVLRVTRPDGPASAMMDRIMANSLAGYRLVYQVSDETDSITVQIYERRLPA